MSVPLARPAGVTRRVAVAMVAALGCDVVLFPMTGIASVTPDFILATVVAVALRVGPVAAIGLAAGGGLLQDVFGGGIIGLHGFACPPSAYLVSRFRPFVRVESRLAVFLLCAAAVPFDAGVVYALEQVTGAGPEVARSTVSVLLGLPVTAAYGLGVHRFVMGRGPNRLPSHA